MKRILPLLLLVLGPLSAVLAAVESTPEQKIAALGLTLPVPSVPIASYVPAVRTGNLVFLSGQIARGPDGRVIAGKIGRDFTEAQGVGAANLCTLQLLAALKAEVGELAKVKRIVRVTGYVNGAENFTGQPKVLNGCSDLLVAVWGEAGKHARSAVGVATLPAGAPVEIELIVEMRE